MSVVIRQVVLVLLMLLALVIGCRPCPCDAEEAFPPKLAAGMSAVSEHAAPAPPAAVAPALAAQPRCAAGPCLRPASRAAAAQRPFVRRLFGRRCR